MLESNLKVQNAAREANLDIEIIISAEPSRTAPEAAEACGCALGQIVKSLVFRGKTSGAPVLLLVSGMNRVDEAKVAAAIGEALMRPDASYVREVTGYAIGGIPPIGHKTQLKTFMDKDLLMFDAVFAAAGTPNSTFKANPASLLTASGAEVIDVK
jgi:prolyl-tRNA editing enzyme YbaK/EbsC (Cys-tRNA(Pro) deacylase)